MRDILLLAILSSVFLGTLAYINNRGARGNRLFAIMTLASALWSFVNYITLTYQSIFWVQLAYSIGSILIASGLIWVMDLTRFYSKKRVLIITLLAGFFSISSFIPGFITYRNQAILPGAIIVGSPGPGLTLYTVYYLSLAFCILSMLVVTIIHTSEKTVRHKLYYIFIGSGVALFITGLSSFILPHFSIYLIAGIDALGFSIFLSIISFNIIKYNFLNIRLASIEFALFILWVLLFFRILYTQNVRDIISNLFLLLTSLILGILLIRSVLIESSQRDKISQLTADLKKAYEELRNTRFQ